MKMYRNYDGNKSTFGETSVAAVAPNPDAVSAFAAMRSADGALTVLVINKQLSTNTTATISLSTFSHRGTAQVWQLTAANAIGHLADIGVGGTSFVVTLPPQSVTLLVVPCGGAPAAPTNLRVIR
jgi:O-glycosyl hydrolase